MNNRERIGPFLQQRTIEDVVLRRIDRTILQERLSLAMPIIVDSLRMTPLVDEHATWENAPNTIRTMYLRILPYMQENLDEHFIDHLGFSAGYAREIVKQLTNDTCSDDVLNQIESLLLLHDISTVFVGDRYRRDYLGDFILKKAGIKETYLARFDSVLRTIGLEKSSIDSSWDLTLWQQIMTISDNLGKFEDRVPFPVGKPFTIERLRKTIQDIHEKENRTHHIWLTPARGEKARLGSGDIPYQVIFEAYTLLETMGVNFDTVRKNALEYIITDVGDWRNEAKQLRRRILDGRKRKDQLFFDPRRETIIFDLGNTLFTVDDEGFYRKTAQALGVMSDEGQKAIRQYIQEHVGSIYGTDDDQEFLEGLYGVAFKFNTHTTMPEDSTKARSVLQHPELYTPRKEMQQLVIDLQRQGKTLGVLSDLIYALVPVLQAALKKHYPQIHLEDADFSSITRASKRDNTSWPYLRIAHRLGSIPTQCLFLDDVAAYRTIAKEIGMVTIDPNIIYV